MCAYEPPGWIRPDFHEPSSATICRAVASVFFQTTRSPFWIAITAGVKPTAAMVAPWSSAPAGAAAARPRTSKGRRMSFRIGCSPLGSSMVCTPMLSGFVQGKTTCNASLHGFYALNLRHAEPAADHASRRLRAAGMAGDGGQEVVAVEREQVGVSRRPNGRGARDVMQERDLAEVRALALPPRPCAVDEDLHLAPLDHVEAVAVV